MDTMINTRAGDNFMLPDEEKKLFRVMAERKGFRAERDYLLVSLTRSTGLRRGEVLALNVADVQGKDEIVMDERLAEKNCTGVVFLSQDIQRKIARYIKLKVKEGQDTLPDAPLFISKKGHRLSLRSFNDIMDYWCQAAGIPRYTPHALRHTKAQALKRKLLGEDRGDWMSIVGKQLRHKCLSSTMIYTAPSKVDMTNAASV